MRVRLTRWAGTQHQQWWGRIVALRTRWNRRNRGWLEAGMSTAEYAVGTLAACTFAALLVAVVRSPAIREALTGLITAALALGR